MISSHIFGPESALITAAFGHQVMGMIFAHNDVSHLFITISGGWPSSTIGARSEAEGCELKWKGWMARVFYVYFFFLAGCKDEEMTALGRNIMFHSVKFNTIVENIPVTLEYQKFLCFMSTSECRSRHLSTFEMKYLQVDNEGFAEACWILLVGIDIRMRWKYCHTASFMLLWYVSMRYCMWVLMSCCDVVGCLGVTKADFFPSNFVFLIIVERTHIFFYVIGGKFDWFFFDIPCCCCHWWKRNSEMKNPLKTQIESIFFHLFFSFEAAKFSIQSKIDESEHFQSIKWINFVGFSCSFENLFFFVA